LTETTTCGPPVGLDRLVGLGVRVPTLTGRGFWWATVREAQRIGGKLLLKVGTCQPRAAMGKERWVDAAECVALTNAGKRLLKEAHKAFASSDH
jgi:hypothetical protein